MAHRYRAGGGLIYPQPRVQETAGGTEQASASRASPVLKAVRSEHAKAKDMNRTAADGTPLHSFRTLLADLGTLAYNIAHTALNPAAKIIITTRPTPLQQKAFALLGLNPACTQ